MVMPLVEITLKTFVITGVAVFGAAVLTSTVCCIALVFQVARRAGSVHPLALAASYRELKSHRDSLLVSRIEWWLRRAQWVGALALLASFLTAMLLVIIAVARGEG